MRNGVGIIKTYNRKKGVIVVKRKRLTEQQKRKIVSLRKAGFTYKAIADAVGTDIQTVVYHVRHDDQEYRDRIRNGVRRRRQIQKNKKITERGNNA